MPGQNHLTARRGLVYQEYVTLWKLLEVYQQKKRFMLEAETVNQGILDDLTLVRESAKIRECYQIKSSENENKAYSLSDFLSNAKKNNIQIAKLFDSWYIARNKDASYACKAILFTCSGLQPEVLEATYAPDSTVSFCVKFKRAYRPILISKIKKNSEYLSSCDDPEIINQFFSNFYIYYNQPTAEELEKNIMSILKELPNLQLATQPMIDALKQFIRSFVSGPKETAGVLNRKSMKSILLKAKFTSETFIELQAKSIAYYSVHTKNTIGKDKNINRSALLNKITTSISAHHCLLIGDHGVGKSGLIKQMVENRKDYFIFDAGNFSLNHLVDDNHVELNEILEYVFQHIQLIIIENCEQLLYPSRMEEVNKLIQGLKNVKKTKLLFVSARSEVVELLRDKLEFKQITIPYLTWEEIKTFSPSIATEIKKLPKPKLFMKPFTLNIIASKKNSLENMSHTNMTIDELIEFSLGGATADNAQYKKNKKILCDWVMGKKLTDTPELKGLIKEGIITVNATGQYNVHTLYKEWAINKILSTYRKFHFERSFQPDLNSFLNTIANLPDEWRYPIFNWISKNKIIFDFFNTINVSLLSEQAKQFLLNYIDDNNELVYSIIDCGKTDVVDLIISDCKKKRHSQFGLLHVAITKANVEMAKYIIEHSDGFYLHDAYVDSEDGNFGAADYCVINHAISAHQNEILSLILEAEKQHYQSDTDINVRDELGMSLQVAIDFENTEAVLILLKDGRLDLSEQIDENGFTPLQNAIQLGRFKIAELLLDYLPNTIMDEKFNPENSANYNPLIRGGTALHLAVFYNRLDILQSLLKRSPNLNARTESGLTALHLAVIFNKFEALQLLLKYSSKNSVLLTLTSDCDEYLKAGDTALTIAKKLAAKMPSEYSRVVKALTIKANEDSSKTLLFNTAATPQSRPSHGTSSMEGPPPKKIKTDSSVFNKKC